jgi:uncharacterized membrane protein
MRTTRQFLTCWTGAGQIAAPGYKFSLKEVALAACLAISSSAFAQQPLDGRYNNIDPPGAVAAGAFGINNDGVAVGRYEVALTGPFHAFLRDEGGSYANVDPPNALWAAARGINNRGSIVGYFCDVAPCGSISTYQGFLLRDGVYKSFGSPIHTNTWPSRINDRGQIVGCDHDTDLMGSMHGFLDKRGNFTDLGVPASMNNGISRDGKTIVGLYTDMMTLASHGYILSNGVLTPFDVPGSTFTNAWDINARGQIVGVYIDTAGKTHGFLRSRTGDYFSIDYPGASSTGAFGLNDVGQIVGRYLDATGNQHAFLLSREIDD